jgi:hypothetical protein
MAWYDIHSNVHITSRTPGLTLQIRQKGGIGSAAYDPKQKDIREFFEGKTVLDCSKGKADDEVMNGENITE